MKENPPLSERFAQAADLLVGTPFVDHGRDPSVGLDCVGLVLVAAREVGVEFEDRAYALVPGADFWRPMAAVIESRADLLPEGGEWRRGDLLGSRFGGMRNHLAVYLGEGWIVHAVGTDGIKRVVTVTMDAALRRMVSAAWRLR